ncbi:MAG: T9SS type A sorting domain-containing protein, partial [Bacteroidales bacterium]|nr:T9SS type A sorting domain-containing protein [Bacteroidales bacterium]
DFISYHLYPPVITDDTYNLTTAFERYKAHLKFTSETVNRPWIIGETSAYGQSYLTTNVHEIVKSGAEQATFAEESLKYSRWYGNIGYSWWMYKDVNWYDDDTKNARHNFTGLVRRLSELQTEKEAAGQFALFNYNDPCADCINPNNLVIANPFNYSNLKLTGTVYHNEQPLPNAMVCAANEKWYWYYTYTNQDGEYYIKTKTSNENLIQVRATYPGLGLFISEWLNNVTSLIITIDDLNQSSLPPLTIDPPPIVTIESGTNITWDSPVSGTWDELIIEGGATLTITSQLYVQQNSVINVKRGGRLIVDGGMISGTCGCGGINVWGTSNQPPNTFGAHGKVELKNGAVIENAITGINTSRMDNPAEGPDPDYCGGQVTATGSTIRNCQVGVYIQPYAYDSWCTFTDCTFETTDELAGGGFYPEAHLKMSGVKNIRVKGSVFRNTRPLPVCGLNQRGMGIYSFDSQFEVTFHCLSGDDPCYEMQKTYFEGLYYGVKALAPRPNKTFVINTSEFTGNYRGLYVSAVPNIAVTANEFHAIADPMGFEDDYCMYLDHCTGYKVEENTVTGNQPYFNPGIGLIVNESGADPNLVYRNNFNSLGIGILTQGCNRGVLLGLELKCNQYDECEMDKVITWEGESPDYVGIAPNQGSSSSNPEDMAGNLFQIDGQIPNGDFDDILNEANHITYYYPLNTDYDDVIPVDFTENTVTPTPIYFEPKWTYENGCPPDETGGGGGGSLEDELRGNIAQSNLSIDSTENLLALLIDGGNTEATQTDVETSIPPETMQVYTDLMNKSPYLSDTVVSTAIEKEDVLPGAMIRDIMVANPNTAKSGKLMSKLDDRWDPLPEYMKAQILAGRSIVSIREEAESGLASFKLRKAKYFNELVRFYLSDTVSPQSSLDSIEQLLQNENSLNAMYRLAMLKGERGAWNEGLAILNNMPVQMTPAEANAHTQFVSFYTLLSGIIQQGKSIVEADSTQIAALVSMEAAQSGIASMYAKNILLALDQTEYQEPVILPDLLKSAIAQYEFDELISKASEAPGYISIRPNPAKDYIVVEYELEQEANTTILISDMKGNLKHSAAITNRQDQLTVDTRHWQAGIYIATLKIKGKLIESVKFTITD